jgi:DNA-binding LacI/PurR family transcriptional regulator
MPLHELGSSAVDALIELMGGTRGQDVVIETPPELVLRRSTGPAPR